MCLELAADASEVARLERTGGVQGMALVPVAADFFERGKEARQPLCREYGRSLESGDILFFAHSPLPMAADAVQFLLRQKQAAGSHHKNIAYKPGADRLSGYGGENVERMRAILRDFSATALACLRKLLPYAFVADFASFRGIEEKGRPAKLKARNDLLHVDSFPTRPTHGRRILRFFVNLNPSQPRVWKTGLPFPELARRYAAASGLLARARAADWQERLAQAGLPIHPRPAYDRFMLLFHHWLKASVEVQNAPENTIWEFPAGSAWLGLTDTVSHAVLSGRYAVEQTVLVEPATLLRPELAPATIFARLAAGPAAARAA